MTEEDKMLERFVREKRRKTERKSLYNLNEEAEDASLLTLTHGGRQIDSLDFGDDFPHDGAEADNGDGGGMLDDEHVRQLHFGGGGGGGDDANADDFEPTQQRNRSYKDIMKEVIEKSKMHKVLF